MAVRRTIAAQVSSGFATSRRPRVGVVIEESIRRWLPQSIVEWLWWPLFAVWAFLPSSRTPVLLIGGVYVTFKGLLLALLGLGTLPYTFIHRNRYRRSFRWTFLPFTALIVYALATALIIRDYPRYEFGYVIFPALQAWFAMCFAVALVSSLPREGLDACARRLVFALGVVAFVYFYVNITSAGGFRALMDVDVLLGARRLSGPLAGPTLFPTLLLVAASFSFCGLIHSRGSLPVILSTSVFAVTIILCGSRGGILGMCFLVILLLLKKMPLRRKLALLVALGLAAALASRYVSWDRFVVFSDNYREVSYQSSVEAWTYSLRTIVFGQGYGSVWPWYVHDAHLPLGESSGYRMFEITRFGRMLYHPHSTYLYVLVEMGLVGLGLFALSLGSQLLPAVRWSAQPRTATKLAPGILASLVPAMFDTMLLKSFEAATVWWIFFFLMSADYCAQREERKAPGCVIKPSFAHGRLMRCGNPIHAKGPAEC